MVFWRKQGNTQTLEAPEIPYRPLTAEEASDLGSFASSLRNDRSRIKFWQGTIPQAEERAQFLREHDYVCSEPGIGDGLLSSVYLPGSHVRIYSPGTCLTFTGRYLEEREVGILTYWAEGGLRVEPLVVNFDPRFGKKQIDNALDFRRFLHDHNIPFEDFMTRERLADYQREIKELRAKSDAIEHLLANQSSYF